MRTRTILKAAVSLLVLAAMAGTARAQEAYPSRAIQMARCGKREEAWTPLLMPFPPTGVFESRPTMAFTPTGGIILAHQELSGDGKRIIVRRVMP